MTGPVIPPLPPGEPEPTVDDPHALLSGYLDHHRAALLRKLDGLSEDELRGSRLPSGWAPLELLRHLTYVERRWLSWGFAAEPVPDPWGDHEGGDADGRWYVPKGTASEEVFTAFHEQCARSRSVVAGVPLGTRARAGGRFPDEERAPSLAWILFHLLQEYGRHLGHLDVARELADGSTGE